MVLFGLTVIVLDSTGSNTAVSLLILTFLVPAVLFSAVAGVYVDRIDRRLDPRRHEPPAGAAFVALYLAGTNLALILLLNVVDLDDHGLLRAGRGGDDPVARAARPAARGERRLHAHPQRGVRARLRPARARSSSSSPAPEAVILVVAALYFLAAVFCFTLPSSPPPTSTARTRIRPGRRRGRAGDGLDVRPAARGPRVHPRATGRSPGRSSTSASPPRSSASSASSGRTSPTRPLGLERRTSWSSSCRSGSGS